jgi:phage terminase Nu1 subunit (DNA packaging protein)
MQTIRDLLSRDLSEPIEEVIKLDQQDERTVYEEITDYVATDRIKRQYIEVLQAIADAPGDPTEGVGVWISGFFGSGKSSFAKNLGYILANRSLLSHPAGRLFVQRLQQQWPNDPLVGRIDNLVSFITARFQTHVVMFDVQVDRAVRRATEPIAEIMYSVLLRELDYAQDFDVADLEIELEEAGRLADFVKACAAAYSEEVGAITPASILPVTLAGLPPEAYAVWQRVRKGAQRIQRASSVLCRLDPTTYPTADSWASSLKSDDDFGIRTLVDRTFELTARRRPNRAIVFVIDEVGQYVARSAEKIENLRAVVEHLGQESKNRLLARKTVAPVWVIVTSQEKLDEVVAAIDDKRVELARLQDRFKIRIDMAPADIREVATRRVLPKKPEAELFLRQRYDAAPAILNTHTHLERTARRSETSRDEFVQFYPYLPHFIDLSIDIVSGIRLQPGAPKHIGGSNRTLIKQAYEMLVSDRTALADAPVGELVSIDRIFDLIEGNLSSEKQRDISDIGQRWPDDPWPARTAKAIALLEYVRDLPRTEANLAALLYRGLGEDSVLSHVERSIALLGEHQFIRPTESGWKLQTAQEKSWSAERNAHNPSPRERNDLLEDQLRKIFEEPALTRYQHGRLRSFRVGVTWDGRALTAGDAQVPLLLRVADGPEGFSEVCETTRADSRTQENEIFWVTSLTDEIDELVSELCRSRQMVAKYESLAAQGKITNEESAILAAEKNERAQGEQRVRDKLERALADGRGFFRGVAKTGTELGKALSEVMKGLVAYAVPSLYPKLEMGVHSLKGTEAEEILKAANLTGLSKIFYAPPDGLGLVAKEGAKYVVNLAAPIVKEVADYLAREHSYGVKVTGRTLEARFEGIGYGWEREVLWLVLATLLRGGAIEVTHQGRRYRNHLDPQVRVPFSATNAFRAASFAPRKAPDLQALVAAARRYEQLTGEDVDVEENAIAQAFQRLARAELEALLPLEATIRAHNIPLINALQEYHTTLLTVLNSASDDCVNMLAGEGDTFQKTRNEVATIRKATDGKGLARLRRMRAAVDQVWPALEAEGLNADLVESVQAMRERLEDGSFYQTSAEPDTALAALEAAYRKLYLDRHDQRQAAYRAAIGDVKAQSSWSALFPSTSGEGDLEQKELQSALLKPLADRAEHALSLPEGALACQVCGASPAQMASDLAAVAGLRSNVLLRVQELTTPEEKVERVRVSDVVGVGGTLGTHDEVERFLEQLRDYLLKLIASGIKVVLE